MFISNAVLWALDLFNIYEKTERIDQLVTPTEVKFENPVPFV